MRLQGLLNRTLNAPTEKRGGGGGWGGGREGAEWNCQAMDPFLTSSIGPFHGIAGTRDDIKNWTGR